MVMTRDPTLFVPSHAGIWTHRKFLRLTRRLATTDLVAFACLHSLWHAANAQTVDGVLRGWDDIDIATAARWPGETAPFVEALVAEGWLNRREDGALEVHDWAEYAGEWRVKREMKREGDRERQRRHRVSTPTSRPVTRDTMDRHADESVTPPDVTHREEKRREEKRGEDLARDAPPAPDLDSGAPEPNIPRRYVGGGGINGFEATYAKVNWCRTAPDVMARYGSAWGHDYPALDGRNGRMTIDQAVRSQWKWFHRTRAQMGDEQVAVDELVRHLSDMNAKHRRDWERDGAPLPPVSRPTGKRPLAEGEEEPSDDTS